VNFFGTLQFGSRAAHARQERSFKDDVESWFYTFCQLLWPGEMPWNGLHYDQDMSPAEKDNVHAEVSRRSPESSLPLTSKLFSTPG
jgi:hypothetical protein